MEAGRTKMTGAQHVLHDSEHHADASRRKSHVPVHALTEISADERREKRARVDAHVVDREAGVTPPVALLIELADEHADVRLEQSCSDDDDQKTEIERRDRRNG